MQIQSLLTAQSEDEFFKALSRAAFDLGFETCAYGMRAPLPIAEPTYILLNNYPKCWQERYTEQNYLAVDPTVAHGMRSVMPIIWSDKIFANTPQFWEDAKAHNLCVGWAQSCHSAAGVGSLLTLARSHDDFSASELEANSLKMSWLSQLAHEWMSKALIQKHLPETSNSLTHREIEVMRWTAEGKTSSEVGEIMNISNATVNFHVNNAVRKLDSANKSAAAIKAILLNLI